MPPETERGKWRKAFTDDGRVSQDRKMERFYNGEKPKGRVKRVI